MNSAVGASAVTQRRGTVLVIEDSPAMAELATALLAAEGFRTVVATTAQDGLEAFRRESPVAVLIDWVLPDTSGPELCRELRKHDELVPILFVSGRGDEVSTARGLDAGADDFLVKPYRERELISRLEAHVRKAAARRHGDGQPSQAGSQVVRFGTVEIDEGARQVRADGSLLALTMLEFDLLSYFCRHLGLALSREQILNAVYGYSADTSTERVDLLVRRLRTKLGPSGEYLVAVPGYGYRLERRAAGFGDTAAVAP